MEEQGADLKKQIKDFIIKTFMFDKGSLRDDQSLFASGIIDSLGFIKLLAFIEKTFSVSIKPSEVVIENFDSVNKIVKLIEKKSK